MENTQTMTRVFFGLGLLAAFLAPHARAAAPPAPFFNGFEKNTAGWFDITSGGDGTITRQPSGYSNGGGYADKIASASGNWHARLTGDPCDHTPATNCFGPFTRWGGYSSTFPSGGYLTQVDIYLDVTWSTTHPDYRFDWDSSINDNTGMFLQDYVFNAGTNPAAGGGFFVNASTNATRSAAFPENPCPSPSAPPNTCRTPVLITVSGWYTFRHTFRNNAGSLAVDFDILQQSTGASVAHWTIVPGHPISGVGGNRYGWFVIEEIPDLPIDNSLRTGLCHQADGDGEVQGKDSSNHHFHFHKNSCGGTDDNLSEDNNSSGSHFQSTSMNSATFTPDDDNQTVTIIGTGLHNGLPVGFTMIAIDNGALAPAVFSLILTDGYSITGSLTSGSISVQ